MTRTARLLGCLLAGLVTLTGCGFKGAYSLPLPGGSGGGSTYKVTNTAAIAVNSGHFKLFTSGKNTP